MATATHAQSAARRSRSQSALLRVAKNAADKGQTPELSTTLVLPNDQRFSDDPSVYKDMFSSVFKLEHITRDRAEAEQIQALGVGSEA